MQPGHFMFIHCVCCAGHAYEGSCNSHTCACQSVLTALSGIHGVFFLKRHSKFLSHLYELNTWVLTNSCTGLTQPVDIRPCIIYRPYIYSGFALHITIYYDHGSYIGLQIWQIGLFRDCRRRDLQLPIPAIVTCGATSAPSGQQAELQAQQWLVCATS